ncbi:uncharacterized protein LOC134077937 [Sardina pilchardus]|uniref:uncharacterized protein LOC134077937 n=1 Tax=Sardina pilchardus TaxID=27697 RepID=UPI002E13C0C9
MFSWRVSVLLFFISTWPGGAGVVTQQALHQYPAPEVQPQTTQDTATPEAPTHVQLHVTLGQTALLPCGLPHPPPSLGVLLLFWQTITDLVVHSFHKGQEEFEHQFSAYCNRTRLFTSQLLFGNFSLELQNVSERDNLTTFKCVVCYDTLTCTTRWIELWTDEIRDVTNVGEDEPGAPPMGRSVWSIVGLLGLLTLLILTIIIIIRCCPGIGNKCSSSAPHNSTDPERGEGPQHGPLMAEEATGELEMREERGGETEPKQDGGEGGPRQWRTALCPRTMDTVEDSNNNSNRRHISESPM